MLFDIHLKVQKTNFSENKAKAIITQLEWVIYFYDEHARHEDRFILTHILQLEPQLSQE